MSVSGKSAWPGLASGTALAALFEAVPICATVQSSMFSIYPSFAWKQYLSVRGSLPASPAFQRRLTAPDKNMRSQWSGACLDIFCLAVAFDVFASNGVRISGQRIRLAYVRIPNRINRQPARYRQEKMQRAQRRPASDLPVVENGRHRPGRRYPRAERASDNARTYAIH